MSMLFRGADLVYRTRLLYEDTKEVIALTMFTEIVARFVVFDYEIEYKLSDSEITIDGNYLNIRVQRDDLASKYRGSWNLVLMTEEADSEFEDSKRIRIGRIIDAINLQDV